MKLRFPDDDFYVYTNPLFWITSMLISAKELVSFMLLARRVIRYPYKFAKKNPPLEKVEYYKQLLRKDIKRGGLLKYAFMIALRRIERLFPNT